MAAIEPFESQHAFQSLEVNADTMFNGVNQKPQLNSLELPADAESNGDSSSMRTDEISEDELDNLYMFDEEVKQPEVDQEKVGFMDRARAFRNHLNDKSFQLGEKLFLTKEGLPDQARAARAHLADTRYRVGEALVMAKLDLPNRHEYTPKDANLKAKARGIKDTSAAAVKSVGSSSANVVSQAVLQNRTGDVLRAVREDYQESDEKLRTLSLGAAVVATEVFDRARLMIFVVPKVTTEVLTNTHSPTQGALAGAGVFTAWNLGTSWVLNHGMNKLPKAKETVKEEFPVAVAMFKDALPGANKEIAEAKKADAQDDGPGRRAGKFLLRHAARGGTGIQLGTTAFVATSSIDGDSLKETRRIYRGVSADTAAFTGLVIAGVGQAIFEMPKHGMAAQSEWLYNGATDTHTWAYLAAATLGLQWNDSRLYKKKLAAREAMSEDELVVLDEDVPTVDAEQLPKTPHQYLINQNIAVQAAQI